MFGIVSKRILNKPTGLSARMMSSSYKLIKSEVVGKVGLITLNRPKQLNALCNELIAEVIEAGKVFDKDDNVGAIVITGSDRAFAAGADIKEMSTLTYQDCYKSNLFANWGDIAKLSKPVSFSSENSM